MANEVIKPKIDLSLITLMSQEDFTFLISRNDFWPRDFISGSNNWVFSEEEEEDEDDVWFFENHVIRDMSSIVLRLATHVIHDIYIRVFSNAANDVLICLLLHCNAYCDKITNSIIQTYRNLSLVDQLWCE